VGGADQGSDRQGDLHAAEVIGRHSADKDQSGLSERARLKPARGRYGRLE